MSTWKNKGFAKLSKLSVLSWLSVIYGHLFYLDFLSSFSSPKIVGKSSKNDNLNNLKRTEKSAGQN